MLSKKVTLFYQHQKYTIINKKYNHLIIFVFKRCFERPLLKILLLLCLPLLTTFCFVTEYEILAHLCEQQPANFSAHLSHCIKANYMLHLNNLYVYHKDHHVMTLGNNISRNFFLLLSSKTKFLPINLFSIPSFLTCLVYSIIPPCS